MPIQIEQPGYLHRQGMREKNEDMIWPWPGKANDQNRLFVVCDGVGGNVYGEKASYLACEQTAAFMHKQDPDLNNLVPFVEKKFTETINMQPDHFGMATTLLFLRLLEDSAQIGWVGDSRAYHIRDGKVMYQTEDHSLVNRLIQTGEITPQEARYDPRKHVLLRALQGEHKPTETDLVKIENLLPGDFFLLCSDGILEALDEAFIQNHFHPQFSTDKVTHYIQAQCEGKTVDNYSMYLVKVIGV